MKPRKAKEPSLRDKLHESFMRDLEADYQKNGATAIEEMRLKSPEKYIDACVKLIASSEPRPDGFEQAESLQELGRKLLKSVGLENEEAMTEDMIQTAIAAQDEYVAQADGITGSESIANDAAERIAQC